MPASARNDSTSARTSCSSFAEPFGSRMGSGRPGELGVWSCEMRLRNCSTSFREASTRRMRDALLSNESPSARGEVCTPGCAFGFRSRLYGVQFAAPPDVESPGPDDAFGDPAERPEVDCPEPEGAFDVPEARPIELECPGPDDAFGAAAEWPEIDCREPEDALAAEWELVVAAREEAMKSFGAACAPDAPRGDEGAEREAEGSPAVESLAGGSCSVGGEKGGNPTRGDGGTEETGVEGGTVRGD